MNQSLKTLIGTLVSLLASYAAGKGLSLTLDQQAALSGIVAMVVGSVIHSATADKTVVLPPPSTPK